MSWKKLGIIAGGGELPVVLAEHCAARGRPYFVARITPYADAALNAHPGSDNGLGHMGRRVQAMREAGVDAVVLIGQVPRPDVSKLELDEGAVAMLPAIMAALPQGDDALLRAILSEHERAGFQVVGAEAVMGDLLAPEGAWGSLAPTPGQLKDIAKGAQVAHAIGAFDIAQGVVICDGHVLALEAAEGTDAMLKRVATLPAALRGSPEHRRGVLVKRPKPIQERRIDLPVIGLRTLEGAAAAGLAGVAVEAHGALAVRRAEMIAEADKRGLFLYGFTRTEAGDA
ncbi:MAG TPA: UDP-2,3-diacylglucosamine diphosphatase LpxI [Vitreimonas sp.]|nr:UDP-2,3-diacylglucosamine diphosphatase LpxI [Vitreimonas sp.]